ncbi:Hypothetical predicted protein [Pelobates cultripes]|uniref:Uncharacterized protein n=1 Tax=Pelobates cultripes TaxID=61616 RepID=A0AAD1RAT0_PELCU|nr:Hypothetical predicted protein [Pelobates cultripes]
MRTKHENDSEHSAKKYMWKKQYNGRCEIKMSVSGHMLSDVPRRIRSFAKNPVHGLKKYEVTTRPKIKPFSASVTPSGFINMIDTIDRKRKTSTEKNFSGSKAYRNSFTSKTGERILKIGAYAETGIGKAQAEVGVLEAEARGPNASAGAEAGLTGVRAMAKAELASASASAGPVGVKVGLGVDTGAAIGVDGVEAKFLGTGIKVGPTTSVSLVGTEVSCVIQ